MNKKGKFQKEREEYLKDPIKYRKETEEQNNEVKRFLKRIRLSRKNKKNFPKIYKLLKEEFGIEIGGSVPITWIKK